MRVLHCAPLYSTACLCVYCTALTVYLCFCRYATEMRDGIIHVIDVGTLNVPDLASPMPSLSRSAVNTPGDGLNLSSLPSMFAVRDFDAFIADFNFLKKAVFLGKTGSYCFQRLEVLSARFHLHELLNSSRENDAQKLVPHRDFYNVRKVDTHVHHSACMNQKHLLRFIKSKLKTCPNEVSGCLGFIALFALYCIALYYIILYCSPLLRLSLAPSPLPPRWSYSETAPS